MIKSIPFETIRDCFRNSDNTECYVDEETLCCPHCGEYINKGDYPTLVTQGVNLSDTKDKYLFSYAYCPYCQDYLIPDFNY